MEGAQAIVRPLSKSCTKCRTPKDGGEFGKDRTRKDGLFVWCKVCVKGHYDPRRQREWRHRNPGRHNHNTRQRLRNDLTARLAHRLRGRLWGHVRRDSDSGSAVRDLGCTIPELRAWLEAKFYPHPETGESMTWENWSRTGWHIDHRRPLSDFDLTDRAQFLEACHYTNLQPLWARANLEKGAKT